METKNNSKTQVVNEQNADADYKPFVDLFVLLLEWDIKDVQEKEEKSKEVS